MFILISILLITHINSYFNMKEINLASTRCNEIGGEIRLIIYNYLTGDYSFECKPK